MAAIPPADRLVFVAPSAAMGEDAVIDLSGTVSAAAWGLAAFASFLEGGDPDPLLSGITAAWVGGSGNVIRVTIPSAVSSVATGDLFVTVWRTDSGFRYPLRRMRIPVYRDVKRYP